MNVHKCLTTYTNIVVYTRCNLGTLKNGSAHKVCGRSGSLDRQKVRARFERFREL